MNILHLIVSSKVGGAQTNLLNLIPHLKHAGCKLYVCFGGKGPLTSEFEEAGAIVKVLSDRPLNYKNLASWTALLRLVSVVKRDKIDVIHAHLDVPFLIAVLTKFVTLTPIVFHIHDFGMFTKNEFPFRKMNWVSFFLSKLIYPLSDKVIAITEETRSILDKRKCLYGKVELLHNGVKVASQPHAKVTQGAFNFIFVGRLTEAKNPGILLKVAEMIPSRYNFIIQIVGGGPLLEPLSMTIRKRGLEERVKLLGFRRDIVNLLEKANCFLLPSLWELCPISILEAMNKGVPVIATDCGTIKDMVEDGRTGFLILPGNQEALAAAMIKMMENRGSAVKMGIAGFGKLEDHFNIEVVSEQLISLYQQVLRR